MLGYIYLMLLLVVLSSEKKLFFFLTYSIVFCRGGGGDRKPRHKQYNALVSGECMHAFRGECINLQRSCCMS